VQPDRSSAPVRGKPVSPFTSAAAVAAARETPDSEIRLYVGKSSVLELHFFLNITTVIDNIIVSFMA